jgi:hypothetical protein
MRSPRSAENQKRGEKSYEQLRLCQSPIQLVEGRREERRESLQATSENMLLLVGVGGAVASEKVSAVNAQ